MDATTTHSRLSEHDIYLFREGSHGRLYDKLGCQLEDAGAHFAVWAPNARAVAVIGSFNAWCDDAAVLRPRDDGSGIWEGFVAGVAAGDVYKYRVAGHDGRVAEKADPFALYAEVPPATGSRAWRSAHRWGDDAWMTSRARANALDAPFSIYELHLGSWRRAQDGALPGYREIAPQLAAYVVECGFTHVELMPLAEHPFYGSWGYQTTGYFAATARYGTPDELMFLIDTLHQAGVGVILDWVPSHFPSDVHGLAEFDGTYLYEHADPRQGFHPEWHSCIFNYGRHEVCAFLLSSALFWLDRFHIDGLRVDAVASMLYLDYGRQHGEWVPNRYGGRENLDAVAFLRRLNEAVYRDHPGVQTIAEESTAWLMVSRPLYVGGLGFGMKWNMGWMHDSLDYFRHDPLFRKFHHGRITFSIWYAFHENFVLPLSHDEVVYGKGSLIGKMPGDSWQQFAGLRALFGYMWAHPGKKLLFMGGEFGQRREWTHEGELEWWVLDRPEHGGLRHWVGDLNRLYRERAALHELDFDEAGFQWIDSDDSENSVLSFLRKSRDGATVLVVCNFTPVTRPNYTLGVPRAGFWREALNSDATLYGGSGAGNLGGVETVPVPAHGHFQSLTLTLPPLAVLFLIPEAGDARPDS
ncbi:1,4-alpha-glucan branching protein GlgB [Aromatoleum bremense]|uniref:1,4-alpha-glucan branching enzyme GlgB n=1 Tax=Aromatoleum bremense TaxID=76115 RepID=A0ABX1NXB6_9RHOO|nr:1,4-alpha-glucan branching protein GlgB [Aromatoleum bremense]NMG16190.1 1,4-alpha-glucan branching protein GlgB [Aromatoleum bremense]QTQ33410.1 1,4-alpha-glucan branching enzyme [Aromatoleum bremense]